MHFSWNVNVDKLLHDCTCTRVVRKVVNSHCIRVTRSQSWARSYNMLISLVVGQFLWKTRKLRAAVPFSVVITSQGSSKGLFGRNCAQSSEAPKAQNYTGRSGLNLKTITCILIISGFPRTCTCKKIGNEMSPSNLHLCSSNQSFRSTVVQERTGPYAAFWMGPRGQEISGGKKN